jgi:hypothetical protein
MVPITDLLVPILVSAVIVFVLSSIIHMVLGYHASDFRPVPNEDRVQDALRPFNLPPGDYILPRPGSMKEMSSPAYQEKCKKGPVAIMTVLPNGQGNMGAQLAQWFLYSVLVGVVSAYVTGRAAGPGAHYLDVFRFAGCTAFLCYSMAYVPMSIWYKKSWGTTFRNMFDGFVYGLFTGGTFGWLWP